MAVESGKILICAPRYDWSCADALAVVYGPTPPNGDAPGGCPTGESGGDFSARNGPNIGGFEVNVDAHLEKVERVMGGRLTSEQAVDALLMPQVNIDVAYLVWLESGGGTFAPWSCRP